MILQAARKIPKSCTFTFGSSIDCSPRSASSCAPKGAGAGYRIQARTQAFPLQGRSSAFKFGRATGALEAVITLCAIPLEIIEPSIWKRYFHLPGKDKEAARLRSITLFPAAHQLFACKRDHQRSEAVLIALYGLRIPQPVTRTHDETPTASNAAVAEDTLIALTVNKGDAP